MNVKKVFLCSVLVVSGDESDVKRVQITIADDLRPLEKVNENSYYPAKAATAAKWTKIKMIKGAKIYDVKTIKEIKGV